MSEAPRTVISALIEKRVGNDLYLLIQTRWKPDKSPLYSGLLEIPSGGVNAFENVYDALRREVREESGIEITNVVGEDKSFISSSITGETTLGFTPFFCQQVLETAGGLPWLGFVFLCTGDGEPLTETDETKDAHWMHITDLRSIVLGNPEQIFPLQLPALLYYLEFRASTS